MFSHSTSVLYALSTVAWSKMSPIVLAAEALSVPFCLDLHSRHLKKIRAPVWLKLTRVTSRCCLFSAKQGSHCLSTPEGVFAEKLCGYWALSVIQILLIVAQVSRNAENLWAWKMCLSGKIICFFIGIPSWCHLICVSGNSFSSAAWQELWADAAV